MSFIEGQRVRVSNRDSGFYNNIGVILRVDNLAKRGDYLNTTIKFEGLTWPFNSKLVNFSPSELTAAI
ncbi:MAG TPA: hypothetical protein VJ044_03570 [Candidatus Hodarchaeales archaeon]|nr:hypothetical protein [Candidatus Hodarchaeales archaeon]